MTLGGFEEEIRWFGVACRLESDDFRWISGCLCVVAADA